MQPLRTPDTAVGQHEGRGGFVGLAEPCTDAMSADETPAAFHVLRYVIGNACRVNVVSSRVTGAGRLCQRVHSLSIRSRLQVACTLHITYVRS